MLKRKSNAMAEEREALQGKIEGLEARVAELERQLVRRQVVEAAAEERAGVIEGHARRTRACVGRTQGLHAPYSCHTAIDRSWLGRCAAVPGATVSQFRLGVRPVATGSNRRHQVLLSGV